MEDARISLADAKARLSEITALAASGETIIITKRGKPLAQLSRAQTPRKPVDLAALQRLTNAMPPQTEDAADFVRRLRDEARY
jgi:antitoxin (DNA-binding transcriptional repressor) of toxin-antitoxin stability system